MKDGTERFARAIEHVTILSKRVANKNKNTLE
jgi:hypothetical protein